MPWKAAAGGFLLFSWGCWSQYQLFSLETIHLPVGEIYPCTERRKKDPSESKYAEKSWKQKAVSSIKQGLTEGQLFVVQSILGWSLRTGRIKNIRLLVILTFLSLQRFILIDREKHFKKALIGYYC